ncbi:MAG: hypothetical protein ACHQSE_15730, partial [Gemmatimonadales bacterium]
GYLPVNPCTGEPPGAGAGPFGGGGVGANSGPQVVPGTYTVALVSGGKTLDTKSMKVIMDPGIPSFTEAVHRRWNDVIVDLQDAQSRGNEMGRRLLAINTQMNAAASKLKGSTTVPAAVQKQFADVNAQFDSVRTRFGVGAPAAGGRGGGGRGGVDPVNALGRVSAVKLAIMGIWESPSAGMVRQGNEAKTALAKAVTEANALLPKIAALGAELKKYDIAVTVPAGH